jgi:hypothetical protein
LFFRLKRTRGVEYLQLVANDRRGAQVRQRVLASLGRLDAIRSDGSLDRLVSAAAAFSGRAVLLAPTVHDVRPELVSDDTLLSQLMDLLARSGPSADILQAFCAPDPLARRNLVASVLFGGLESVAKLPRGLQTLHAVGMRGVRDANEIVSFAMVAKASPERQAGTKQEGLIIALKPAGASGSPSMARGLVTFLAMTQDGLPLAAGHWPAHLPPLKMATDLAARITRQMAAASPVLVFDRSFSSDAFLSALGKLGLDFMLPLRETNSGPILPDAWEHWTCHETRSPRSDSGGGSDPAGSFRLIQILDNAVAERDWRLRNAQMERLRRIVAAVGANSPNAQRLQAAQHSLEEAQRWDGVTLLATNLTRPPAHAARIYGVASAIRAWEHELTAFGRKLLEMGTSPRDTDALLAGGASVGLVAAFMRHTLTELLGRRLGRSCGWDEIRDAVSNHRAVRLVQGDRVVTLAFEADPALAGLLEVLGVSRPQTAKRQNGPGTLRGRRMHRSG